MIDGKGMLPGDVLTASNGKTVEVSRFRNQKCVCQPIMHALKLLPDAEALGRTSTKCTIFTGPIGRPNFESILVCCFDCAATDKKHMSQFASCQKLRSHD